MKGNVNNNKNKVRFSPVLNDKKNDFLIGKKINGINENKKIKVNNINNIKKAIRTKMLKIIILIQIEKFKKFIK